MEQIKKEYLHKEAVPEEKGKSSKQDIEAPDVSKILSRADREIEKKKEEQRKMAAIIDLINRNMKQVERGEEPTGACTCF
jgi:hypothetical protein